MGKVLTFEKDNFLSNIAIACDRMNASIKKNISSSMFSRTITKRVLCLLFLVTNSVFSYQTPPVPAGQNRAVAAERCDCDGDGDVDNDDDCICPPPSLSIDASVTFLLIAGMVLGVYMIFKYKQKQKAPN